MQDTSTDESQQLKRCQLKNCVKSIIQGEEAYGDYMRETHRDR